jgi:hypothetical protein
VKCDPRTFQHWFNIVSQVEEVLQWVPQGQLAQLDEETDAAGERGIRNERITAMVEKLW